MARFPSGTTDQYIYFDAFDASDLVTRETGLTSFTVYRSKNGGAATAFTTPTVVEISSSNMPGVYALLLDEGMDIGVDNESEDVCLFITHVGMAPVSKTFELYTPLRDPIQDIDNKIVVIDALCDFIYDFTDELPTALPALDDKIDILDTNLDGLIDEIGVAGAGLTDIPLNSEIPTAAEIADEVETKTLNSNIVSVNSVAINGAGSEENPWGPV